MTKYNQIQKQLVETCERLHYNGIRHKGLSGTACEDLLILELRKHFPELKCNRGVIKFKDTSFGADLHDGDISTQLDIIIYKNKELYESCESVVVHTSNVVAVIEVKKWIKPTKNPAAQGLIDNLEKVKKSIPSIPLLLVSFRVSCRRDDKNWYQEVKGYNNGDVYCFSGTYTVDKGVAKYPWEEKDWNDFENTPYANQFEKLINDIKEYSS